MLFLGDLELPAIAIRSIIAADGGVYPAQEVIQGKPRRQFVGPAGEKITIACFLHFNYAPPRPMYQALRALSGTGRAVQVWTRAGGYWGTYVIDAIEYRPVMTLEDGRVLAAHCSFDLSESGVPELELPERPAPLATSTTARDTVDVLPPEDTARPIEEISAQEIARV